MSRVLLWGLLLLALLAGSGVVATDGEQTVESDCPALTNEKGSRNAPDTAHERSLQGRSIALVASKCV